MPKKLRERISPEIECNVKRFKGGIKERKYVLKHRQTVEPHATAPSLSVVMIIFGKSREQKTL